MTEAISKIHIGTVLATMIRELGAWSWDTPYCKALFAFFVFGMIPQFVLLRMRWKPWLISLTLGALVVLCDFCAMCMPGVAHEFLSLIESFFIAALVGAGLSGAVHIFWEIFKKRPESEGSPWLLSTDKKKEEK